MDNVAKLKKDIEALKKGIDNPSTPENFKDKMRSTMAMLQKQVDEASKGREPKMPPSKKGDEAPKAKKPRGSGKPNPDFAKVQKIAKELKAKDPSLKHTKAVSMAWEQVRGGGAPKKEAPKKEAPKKEAPKPTPKSRAKDLKERVKKNTKSKDRDGVRYAKPVGKRVSAEGNTYYEYRENRTDSNIGKRSYKKPRLFAKGGKVSQVSEEKLSDSQFKRYNTRLQEINNSQMDNDDRYRYVTELIHSFAPEASSLKNHKKLSLINMDYKLQQAFKNGERLGYMFKGEKSAKEASEKVLELLQNSNLGVKDLIEVKYMEVPNFIGVKGYYHIYSSIPLDPIDANKPYSYFTSTKYEDGGMTMMHGGEHYADGGRVSDMADYITKYDIKSIEVEMDGKKVTLEGSQLLDGIYVKKGCFMAGGMTYKRGGNTGNYNYKRSWKMDRARVATKQDYEKYYKRKTK